MMKFRRKRSPGVENIPLTSMTDIMFLLLTFLMVTASFQASSGIPVKLPSSTAQIPEEKIERVVISIKEDGGVFVDNEPAMGDALKRLLEEHAKKNPDMLVVIRADKSVMHGRVVEIMDAAREAGLTKLAIATVVEGGH